MADRYLLESGSPDGYLLESGSGVLLLEAGSTGKVKIAWGGALVSHTSDVDRGRVSWFGLLVSAPLEDRGRIAWHGATVSHTSDVNRGRVSWFGALVSHTGDEVVAEPVPSAECICGPGTWILDLDVGGRVFRYSTREMTVRDARGLSYLYQAGLADFDMTLDGKQQSQAFDVIDRRVNWAQLVASGEALALAPVLLRHIAPDQVLEEALVILDGSVDEPEYGSPGRPAALTGTIQLDEADRAWPDPRATVTSATWEFTPLEAGTGGPQYDPAVVGAIYPTVFGYPGSPDDGGSPIGTTPALMVAIEFGIPHVLARFAIAEGLVDAASVVLYATNQTLGTGGLEGAEQLSVTTTTDELGRVVSIVTVPVNDTAIYPTIGQEYYIGWADEVGRGGGSLLPDGSGPIRKLTDVALWALRKSGRRVDLEAQEAERARLDVFNIDGALTSALEGTVPWFESTLLPLFPLLRARTSRGMYWRFVDYAAGPTAGVAHLDVDAGQAIRTSSIRAPLQSVRNQFTLWYGYNLRSGQYGQRRSLGPVAEAELPWYQTPSLVEDERVVGSPLCARSDSTFGPRPATKVDTKFIWDSGTAGAILRHWAARDTFPRQMVSYAVSTREARNRVAGDIVTVTDAEVGFDREVAMVVAVHLSSDRLVELELAVLDRRVRG